MRRTRRRIGTVLLASVLASAAALEWPLAGGFPSVPFGSHHAGRFVTCVSMSPAGAPVVAAASGEVVFQYDGDKLPSGFPCTLGGFVALHHPDGLLSVYSRLERGSLPQYLRNVAAGDVLGRAGTSGFYSSKELSFALYDRVKRQYLNPQVLLPPVRDDKAPLVRQVHLASGARSIPLGEARALRQGTYEVIADIQDASASADPRPRACYSVRLLIDGTERARYVYDSARAEGGRLVFFGAAKLDAASFFLPDGRVRLGSFLFSRGRSTIVLAVSDYAGNEREAAYAVSIE